MGNERQEAPQPGNDRIDLNRAVELRFEKFQDFLTEVAGNISPGGMFVKSKHPHAPGEQFEFACSLADGFPLVCGRGEVVWVREESDSDAGPPGMGVRFLELFENSGELIEKIIEQRQIEGEDTFDLEIAGAVPEPEEGEDFETPEVAVSESTAAEAEITAAAPPTDPASDHAEDLHLPADTARKIDPFPFDEIPKPATGLEEIEPESVGFEEREADESWKTHDSEPLPAGDRNLVRSGA